MHHDELTVLLRVENSVCLRHGALNLVRIDMYDVVIYLLLTLLTCLRTIVLLIGQVTVHEELPADEAHRGGDESCVTTLQTSGDDLHLLVNVGIFAKLIKDVLVGGAGHGKVEPVVLGT